MKSIKLVLFTVLLFSGILTLISGCDKVERPFVQKCNNEDPSLCAFPSLSNQQRVVLLEDYTGHTCGNCPAAGDEAHRLEKKYGDSLVVMAIHAGGFANITAAGTTFDYDFRTVAGNNLNKLWGITSNPNGLVNRKDYPSSHVKDYSSWETEVARIITTPPDANLFLINTYDATSRKLNVCAKSKWINSMSGSYRLILYLTEDSIIKPQIDYRLHPDTVLQYLHMHVLRSVINCEEGDILPAANAGSSVVRSYTMTLSNEWMDKHCNVVAAIYNAGTYEVVQAAEKKIRP